jgi:hypothetical protein
VALFTQLNGTQESNKASKEAYLGTSAVFLDFGMTCFDVTSAAFTLQKPSILAPQAISFAVVPLIDCLSFPFPRSVSPPLRTSSRIHVFRFFQMASPDIGTRDCWDSNKYQAWLKTISNECLRLEYRSVQSKYLKVLLGLIGNAVLAVFTIPSVRNE